MADQKDLPDLSFQFFSAFFLNPEQSGFGFGNAVAHQPALLRIGHADDHHIRSIRDFLGSLEDIPRRRKRLIVRRNRSGKGDQNIDKIVRRLVDDDIHADVVVGNSPDLLRVVRNSKKQNSIKRFYLDNSINPRSHGLCTSII